MRTNPVARMDPVHLVLLTPSVSNTPEVGELSSLVPPFRPFRYQMTHVRAHSSAMEIDCGSDYVPKCSSACGQNDSCAHSSAMEDDCCSSCIPSTTSECGQECRVVTGPTPKAEQNAVGSAVIARASIEMSPLSVFG
jgi:hypothetical protein